MSIYVDLRDKLYDSLLVALPTSTIIQAYNNGPEPQTPYVVYDVVSVNEIGREYISTLVSTNTQQIISQYEVRVRVEFIGEQSGESNFAAAELSNNFYFDVNKTNIQETFLKNNLSYIRKDTIKRVPKKRETDWYMCYQVDLIFGYQVESRQNVDSINSVEVTSVYTKPTDTNPVVITSII